MALGPGKYDAELAAALSSLRRKHRGISGGVLIVHSRIESLNGFSARLSLDAMLALPAVLREVADQIEAGRRGLGGEG
jgi:hypothetical protein